MVLCSEPSQSLQQDLQSQVEELQQQLLSSSQQLMRKEAELIRAEEIHRREHQQIQEIVSLMILIYNNIVILHLFQRETIRKNSQEMQEMRRQVSAHVHVSIKKSKMSIAGD